MHLNIHFHQHSICTCIRDMEKDNLPLYGPIDALQSKLNQRHYRRSRIIKLIALGCLVFVAYTQWFQLKSYRLNSHSDLSISKLHADLATCTKLQHKPQDPSGHRDKNARWTAGNATLVRNATVWTGEPISSTTSTDAHADGNFRWITTDVLLQYGLIAKVARHISVDDLPPNCLIWNAQGRQLTAGIVDMHSHTGVYPLPTLWGGSDGNELSDDITPMMRSIDGLDPLDHQMQVIKSGGGMLNI